MQYLCLDSYFKNFTQKRFNTEFRCICYR